MKNPNFGGAETGTRIHVLLKGIVTKMKVLYATSEARPFAASGGLADVAGSLPAALRKSRVGCRVVMPLYESTPSALREQMQFLTAITVPVDWRRQYCGIFEARHQGVTYYLLDNEYYFKRAELYGHFDDGERFAFFARAILEILPHIDFKPDVLHCNDWQTALVPVYYTAQYAARPGCENIKTILTIHNMQYQGIYGQEILGDVFGLAPQDFSLVAFDGCINLLKGGIECADAVTTVSPTYAEEILDPWFSHGLDPILRLRREKLCGILNGIDTVDYDPETDKVIDENYSAERPQNKAKNKAALQKLLGLPVSPRTPLFGIVSRLVTHKGFDLLRECLYDLLQNNDMQLAILGSGDWQYERFFEQAAADFPEKVALYIGFVPDLARKIYAGSDLFLMPSKAEPCGLSQMISLRYGSIPIVRETGGLRDSVTDSGLGEGNGFVFSSYNAAALHHTICRAIQGYADEKGWQQLVTRAMECDNSWRKSALEYLRLYRRVAQGQAK